jgi:hypothetical protein
LNPFNQWFAFSCSIHVISQSLLWKLHDNSLGKIFSPYIKNHKRLYSRPLVDISSLYLISLKGPTLNPSGILCLLFDIYKRYHLRNQMQKSTLRLLYVYFITKNENNRKTIKCYHCSIAMQMQRKKLKASFVRLLEDELFVECK